MLTKLFEKVLITPANIKDIAEILAESFTDRKVAIELTRQDGKVNLYTDLTLYPVRGEIGKNSGGIKVALPDERGGFTNSAHLTLIFKNPESSNPAFHFETSDDPIFKKLGKGCFKITADTITIHSSTLKAMLYAATKGILMWAIVEKSEPAGIARSIL